MATSVAVPAQALLDSQSQRYAEALGIRATSHGALIGSSQRYMIDLLRAHKAAGLLRGCKAPSSNIHSREGVGLQADTRLVELDSQPSCWVAASLCPTKDMEVLVVLDLHHGSSFGSAQRPQGSDKSCPSSEMGIGAPAFCQALYSSLRALIDDLGVQAFNVGILNLPLRAKGGECMCFSGG
jgi:hypothetical protein